jgi:hypothetical protein
MKNKITDLEPSIGIKKGEVVVFISTKFKKRKSKRFSKKRYQRVATSYDYVCTESTWSVYDETKD